jgi:hypothetical protein
VGRCLDVAANLAGLIGVLLLAAPAFYAAKYGLLAYRLVEAGPIDPDDPAAVEIYESVVKDLTDHQSHWTPALSRCLKAGTFIAGLGYLFGLAKALMT